MSFAEGQNPGALESDRKLALALVQEIAIIGEAAGRVSREVTQSALRIVLVNSRPRTWDPVYN
jgi:uncharacterized protein with HEPN domain